MKRFLSFIVALSLIMGLGVTAFAADPATPIAEAAISGVSAVEGETISTAGITAPAGANYEVSAKWMDTSSWPAVEATGTFQRWSYYDLYVTFTAKDGYAFDDSTVFSCDGMDMSENWIKDWQSTETQAVWYCTYAIEPALINEITLQPIAAPEAGQTITAPSVALEDNTVPVTVVGEWVDDSYQAVTGTFEDGKIYYLKVTATITDTNVYGFNWGADFYMNGEYITYGQSMDHATAEVYIRYSLLPTIDVIDITIGEVAVGGNAADVEITVPDNAQYAITYIYWQNRENMWETVTTFADEQVYSLGVTLEPVAGVEFAEDAEVYINGEYYDNAYISATYASVNQDYSFLDEITEVDITVGEVAVGGNTADVEVSVADGSNYYISYSEWYNASLYVPADTFEDGYRYALSMSIQPEGLYTFAEDVVVKVNGEVYEDWWGDETYIGFEQTYSFADVQASVAVPAWPELKVGDTVSRWTAVQGEEEGYIDLYIYTLDENGNFNTDGDTVTIEEGKNYYAEYSFSPKAGHEFTDETVITVGGKEWDHYTNGYVGYSYGYMSKLYAFGDNVITKIELTIEEPEIGATPGEITVSEDADYEIVDSMWGVNDKDDINSADTLEEDDKFEKGKFYWSAAVLTPKDGYIFADEVEIYINGKLIEQVASEEMGDTVDLWYAMVFNAYGELGVEPIPAPAPEQKPSTGTNAPTGDFVPVAALVSLVVLAAAAMTVAIIGKKKYCK